MSARDAAMLHELTAKYKTYLNQNRSREAHAMRQAMIIVISHVMYPVLKDEVPPTVLGDL